MRIFTHRPPESFDEVAKCDVGNAVAVNSEKAENSMAAEALSVAVNFICKVW